MRYGSSRNKEATEIKIYQILFHNIEYAIPDKIVINGLSFLPRADLPKEAEQKIVRYVESKRVRKQTVESYGTTHYYAGTYRRRGRKESHRKNRCWSHQAKSPDPTRSSCTRSVLMPMDFEEGGSTQNLSTGPPFTTHFLIHIKKCIGHGLQASHE